MTLDRLPWAGLLVVAVSKGGALLPTDLALLGILTPAVCLRLPLFSIAGDENRNNLGQ